MDTNSKNLGSIIELKLALLTDIYSISKSNDLHQVNVTFFPNHDWTKITFQKESAKYEEKPKTSPAGYLLSQELVFNVMNVYSENTVTFSKLINVPLVFLITDANGNNTLFGSLDNPCFISMHSIRRQKPEDPTRYKIESKRQANWPSYFYPRTDDPGIGIIVPDPPVEEQ